MGIPQLVVAFLFATLMLVMIVVAVERGRREKHRAELQKAILERVGSVKDFAEFLTTEQGERFLASLAPAQFSAHHRGLWSVQIGIVLAFVGVALMFALHTVPGASSDTPLVLMLLVMIATGVGMLLSAVVSFFLGRALGPNRRGRS